MKKNSLEKKVYLASVILLGLVFLGLIVVNIFWGDHWIDSDMAAEMMFSDLIAKEGGLFSTTNWYYSTEFRVLYTQLIMVPLFHIFKDWHVIRVITNVITYVLLLASYFYFMKPLGCKRVSITLSAVILLLPFSETFVTHMQFGNTYMPHVIIIFFCFGMYLRLVKSKSLKEIQGIVLLVLYCGLSVICGMSGVRYLLALQAPLMLTAVVYLMNSREYGILRREVSPENVKSLLSGEKLCYVLYSVAGVVCALAGYVINMAIIAKKFDFQTYDVTNFIQVFQGVLFERTQDTIGNLLMLFGYISNKSFLSLRGLITIISFAFLIGIVMLVIRLGKLLSKEEKFIYYFLIVAFVLNTFVFLFTTSTIVSRYYITVFIFVLPLLCMYFEKEEYALDKLLVFVILACCLALTTAKCLYSMIDKDKNAEERKVVAYLQQEDYAFGYASYWNGNIMTELSDGAVEIANIQNLDDMSFFRWSSPTRYYEEGYHTGKTFLLLTLEEWDKYSQQPVIVAGAEVYKDETYVVLHYDSVEEMFGANEKPAETE